MPESSDRNRDVVRAPPEILPEGADILEAQRVLQGIEVDSETSDDQGVGACGVIGHTPSYNFLGRGS